MPFGSEVHCYTDRSRVPGHAAWAFTAYVWKAGSFKVWLRAVRKRKPFVNRCMTLTLWIERPRVWQLRSHGCWPSRRESSRTCILIVLAAGYGADGSRRIPADSRHQPRRPFELARALFVLHQMLGRSLRAHHVKSHTGDPFNELVDRVARAAAQFGPSTSHQWKPWTSLLAWTAFFMGPDCWHCS